MIPLDAESGKRWLARGGLVLAGAVAGFLLRGGSSEAPQVSPIPGANSPITSTLVQHPSVSSSFSESSLKGDGETAEAPLSDPLAAFVASFSAHTQAPGIEGVIAFYEAVRKLPPELFPEAIARTRDLPEGQSLAVVVALAGRWAEFDPAAAATHIFSMRVPNETVHTAALQAVVQRWAMDAPDAAFAWIHANAPIWARPQLLSILASTLGRTDPQRAIALLHQVPGNSQAARDLGALYGEWAGRDPHAAAAAALALPGGGARSAAISGIAGAWAKSDPASALAWAATISEPRARDDAFRLAVTQWANTEPSAALAWLGNFADAGMKRQLVNEVLRQWVKIDAAAARNHALSLPPAERNIAIQTVARGLAGQDATAAMELVQQLPPGLQTETGRWVVMSLADRDPPAAAQLLLSLPMKVGFDQARQEVAYKWAQLDPMASAEWVLQFPPGQRNPLINVVGWWARSDPAAAAEWYVRNEFGKEGSMIVQTIAEELAANDEDAALRWSESLADAPRTAAIAAIAASITARDPARAIQIVAQLPTEAQAGAFLRIVSTWAEKDPAAAARWTATLPEAVRGYALQNAVSAWVKVDTVSAVSWMQTLPVGEERDGVVVSFANEIVRDDPEGALAWAATISDGKKRSNQFQNLANQWMFFDSASARRWVEGSSDLSAEAKEQLLKRQ